VDKKEAKEQGVMTELSQVKIFGVERWCDGVRVGARMMAGVVVP
jgi:hypothetical protein